MSTFYQYYKTQIVFSIYMRMFHLIMINYRVTLKGWSAIWQGSIEWPSALLMLSKNLFGYLQNFHKVSTSKN